MESAIISEKSFFGRVKDIFIGKAKLVNDHSVFHKLSLVAFFAWIGLGSDGLSSSCYGPEEAFRYLQHHPSLSIFVALGSVFTIFIISSSYNQIVKLFPHGGGGYLVGSRLLSPTIGMISGCALIIDYVLTIAISVSSGSDALFSFFSPHYQIYKLSFAVVILFLLILLNMRGVKESVLSLTPIFVLFILTHVFVIIYGLMTHLTDFSVSVAETHNELQRSISELGLFGTLFIILKAYSMGAGTYTGIEAVSNGLPILREPKVKTARMTMRLMAISLSFMVLGLMMAYSLYHLKITEGKTLNAVLLQQVTLHWGVTLASVFILITLASEAALLFVAAQTGFIDGPRIMANMATDLWLPKKFSSLSDRFVTLYGVLIMGGASLLVMVLAKGSVGFLVVLYSINVFITFSISQAGMVRHWWTGRRKLEHWRRNMFINGIGLILTSFILIVVTVSKFTEGGWITLLITGLLALLAVRIKRHYYKTKLKLQKLRLAAYAQLETDLADPECCQCHNTPIEFDPKGKTAIILVSGFGGTGLYSFLRINKSFKGVYKNFVFIRIGVLNAKNFKSSAEVEQFKLGVKEDGLKYVKIANQFGYYGKSMWTIGTDPVSEVYKMVKRILPRVNDATFFGGQLIFSKTFYLSKTLHNHTIFSIQRRFFKFGIPIVILPIKID